MAQLLSEDKQVTTSFSLNFLKDKIQDKISISWIPYKLVLKSADKELTYEKDDSKNGAGDYVLALKPVNEIENLINGIKGFLENKNTNMFSFEAIEPSFELVLERSHKGYSVVCWLDAGNVISDHYSWDGFGIRFFTSEKGIRLFIDELEKESRGICPKEKI